MYAPKIHFCTNLAMEHLTVKLILQFELLDVIRPITEPSLPKSYYIVPVWAFMVIKHSIVLTWVTCYEIVKIIRQNRYQQLSTK